MEKGLSEDGKWWKDQTGNIHKVTEMADPHLTNAINYAKERIHDFSRAYNVLGKERARRASVVTCHHHHCCCHYNRK